MDCVALIVEKKVLNRFEQRMKCKVMLRSSSEYIFLEREQCCGNINKIAHSELD